MVRHHLGVAFLLVFLSAGTAGLIMPVLPIYIRYELGGSITIAGFLMSLVSIPQLIIRIPLSMLSDRVGRKPLMTLGLFLYGTAYTAYSLVQTTTQLGIFILLHGLGMASYWPASLAYLGDLTQAKHKRRSGRIVGGYTAVFGFAYTIGSFVGGYTVEHFSFSCDFYLAALFGFLGGLIAFIGVSDVNLPKIQKDTSQRRFGLNLRRSLKVLVSNESILFALASIFLSASILPAILVFFPLYAKNLGTGEALIGLAMMVNIGCASLARLPGGQLSERMNRYLLLGGALLLLATGIFLIPFSNSFSVLLFCLALAGLGSGVILSATLVTVMDGTQPSDRGFAIGLQGTLRHIGRVLGPIIMGLIAERSGLNSSFLFGAAVGYIGLLALFLLLSLMKHSKNP